MALRAAPAVSDWGAGPPPGATTAAAAVAGSGFVIGLRPGRHALAGPPHRHGFGLDRRALYRVSDKRRGDGT